MKKTIPFMALALTLAMGFATSCGDDETDEPRPIEPTEEPKPEEPTTQDILSGTYGGWTQGSNEYAPYIPSEGDTLTIEVTNAEGTLCNLHYMSPTWGDAVLTGVSVEKNDTAYLLSKPITATLLEDHSAWTFSAQVDSIAMPNRNPQSQAVTVKNYPITLENGFISLDLKNWEINFKAYLVPRSGHTQNMCFRDGRIGEM